MDRGIDFVCALDVMKSHPVDGSCATFYESKAAAAEAWRTDRARSRRSALRTGRRGSPFGRRTLHSHAFPPATFDLADPAARPWDCWKRRATTRVYGTMPIASVMASSAPAKWSWRWPQMGRNRHNTCTPMSRVSIRPGATRAKAKQTMMSLLRRGTYKQPVPEFGDGP